MAQKTAAELSPPDAPKSEARTAGYRALPGAADEMIDNKGNVRPVWQALVSAIDNMPEQDLNERFARADRYLRDAGVFYRAYGSGGSSERAWPFSHIPVMISEAEWQVLADGLVQRANLL